MSGTRERGRAGGMLAGLLGRRGPAPDLTAAMDDLTIAVDQATGRLPDADLAVARAVLARGGERMRLSAGHTVVALAGATGSGKSSLFNALTGIDLAEVGVHRPTTAVPLACVWGAQGAVSLLDWLGIPRRHQLTRESPLEPVAPADLDGLVLLDLPDHDSTRAEHRREVDRLIGLVDLFCWVVDPQKYADRVLHERYLRRYAAHRGVTLLVLNQVDLLTAAERAACVADLGAILAADGLPGVRILGCSARTGAGVAELRAELADRVATKRAAAERVAADVVDAGRRLLSVCGSAPVPSIGKREREALTGAFAAAAGVPAVVAAVDRSYRLRATQATGWPVTKWLARLRPDPLRRLHLAHLAGPGRARPRPPGPGDDPTTVELSARGRSALPGAAPVQAARVEQALRAAADAASEGLTEPWALAVRRATHASADTGGVLVDALDQAVVRVDLGVRHEPRWWAGLRLTQWLVFALAVAGAVWLVGLGVLGYLRLPPPPTPSWHGVAVPTMLLVGGVVVGLLTAFGARLAARVGARRQAAAAAARLRAAVAGVVDRLVMDPARRELAAYDTCRSALLRIADRG